MTALCGVAFTAPLPPCLPPLPPLLLLLQAVDVMKGMAPEHIAAMGRQAGRTMDVSAVTEMQRQLANMSSQEFAEMQQQAASMDPQQLEAMAKMAAMGPDAQRSPAGMAQAAEVGQICCCTPGGGGGGRQVDTSWLGSGNASPTGADGSGCWRAARPSVHDVLAAVVCTCLVVWQEQCVCVFMPDIAVLSWTDGTLCVLCP